METKKIFTLKAYVNHSKKIGMSDSEAMKHLSTWGKECIGLTKEEMLDLEYICKNEWLEEVEVSFPKLKDGDLLEFKDTFGFVLNDTVIYYNDNFDVLEYVVFDIKRVYRAKYQDDLVNLLHLHKAIKTFELIYEE